MTATVENSVAVSTGVWVGVCTLADLTPGRAVCAVVGGHQVAVALTADGEVFGVSNRDPFSGAFVMSRGIVGTRTVDGANVHTLQSPMFKQAFDLATGKCLDGDASKDLAAYPVRVVDGVVEVRADRP